MLERAAASPRGAAGYLRRHRHGWRVGHAHRGLTGNRQRIAAAPRLAVKRELVQGHSSASVHSPRRCAERVRTAIEMTASGHRC